MTMMRLTFCAFIRAVADPLSQFAVGGETLDLALEHINTHGRIIACGAISQYNKSGDERYGLRNTMQVVAKQLRYEGFIMDADKDLTEFYAEVGFQRPECSPFALY